MTANPNLAAHQKSLGKQGAFIDVNAVASTGRRQYHPKMRAQEGGGALARQCT